MITKTKNISTIQKLHFILLSKGKVWAFKRMDTTWVTLNKMLDAKELEEFDALLIDKVFTEVYPDGVYDLEYFIKLASLLAIHDKTSIAPRIGITMYKMSVRLKTMDWKEKEILAIEKVYSECFEDNLD